MRGMGFLDVVGVGMMNRECWSDIVNVESIFGLVSSESNRV